jgi:hypothetical protein
MAIVPMASRSSLHPCTWCPPGTPGWILSLLIEGFKLAVGVPEGCFLFLLIVQICFLDDVVEDEIGFGACHSKVGFSCLGSSF